MDVISAARWRADTIADQEAVRLLQLVRFRTEEMLDYAYGKIEFENHPEIGTFDRSTDAMSRSANIFVQIVP
jgi:hypothetical protein